MGEKSINLEDKIRAELDSAEQSDNSNKTVPATESLMNMLQMLTKDTVNKQNIKKKKANRAKAKAAKKARKKNRSKK